MREFVKPNATAINRIVYYSVLLRDIKITLLQLRRTILMVRGLGVTVPSYTDLKDVEVELIRRAGEVQLACRLLFMPLLEGIDFGHEHLNHWAVSMQDIKRGYCELEEILKYKDDRPELFGRKFIMLLRDFSDPTLGTWYAGELIPFEKAVHFIDSIPENKEKLKGLYDAMVQGIGIAIKYRLSKVLSDE